MWPKQYHPSLQATHVQKLLCETQTTTIRVVTSYWPRKLVMCSTAIVHSALYSHTRTWTASNKSAISDGLKWPIYTKVELNELKFSGYEILKQLTHVAVLPIQPAQKLNECIYEYSIFLFLQLPLSQFISKSRCFCSISLQSPRFNLTVQFLQADKGGFLSVLFSKISPTTYRFVRLLCFTH